MTQDSDKLKFSLDHIGATSKISGGSCHTTWVQGEFLIKKIFLVKCNKGKCAGFFFVFLNFWINFVLHRRVYALFWLMPTSLRVGASTQATPEVAPLLDHLSFKTRHYLSQCLETRKKNICAIAPEPQVNFFSCPSLKS